tara:strand:+ start:533 stop:661 length:129 start_codon:yes stop_codon:yes gene_type:complete
MSSSSDVDLWFVVRSWGDGRVVEEAKCAGTFVFASMAAGEPI